MAIMLESVHHIQRSLQQVQLRWFITSHKGHHHQLQQQKLDGDPLTVHVSITDHHGDDDDVREWIYERAGRENVEDVYDLPSRLLLAGHRYEIGVKVMLCEDNGLRCVLDRRTLNFRLGQYREQAYSSPGGYFAVYFTCRRFRENGA